MALLSANINGLVVEIETDETLRPQDESVIELFDQIEVFDDHYELDSITVTNPAPDQYQIEIRSIDGKPYDQTVELQATGMLITWQSPDTVHSDELDRIADFRDLIVQLARNRELIRFEADWV